MDSAEIQKLGKLEDRHWWYAERRWLIRQALAHENTTGVALDVGAAAGGNTRVLRELGWTCAALEYSDTGAALAHGRGLTVLRADATRLPFADDSLGLVVAFDVLEHIGDDHRAASEILRCLRPGGRLLAAVPADMRLWSSHDVAVGHVRRYERAELTSLARDCGFQHIEIRSWNVLLRPAVAWRRRRSSGSDLDDPGRLTNPLLRSVVRLERALPLRRAGGVSLLLSARKAA